MNSSTENEKSIFVLFEDGKPVRICETLEIAKGEMLDLEYEWNDSQEVSREMSKLDEEYDYSDDDECDEVDHQPFFEIKEYDFTEGVCYFNPNGGELVYSDSDDFKD